MPKVDDLLPYGPHSFRSIHYLLNGKLTQYIENFPYPKEIRIEQNTDSGKFYASIDNMWRIIHREDGPAVYSNDSLPPNLWYKFDGKYWVRWIIYSQDRTQEILKWIEDSDLPHWEEWTIKEKILFKMKFI